jgi:hypothetical protein
MTESLYFEADSHRSLEENRCQFSFFEREDRYCTWKLGFILPT